MNLQLRHRQSGQRAENGHEVMAFSTRPHAQLLAQGFTRGHYSSVLQVGCTADETAAQLAGRADRYLVIDDAPRAVERERARLICRPQARARHASIPGQWPRREFDLILLSDIIARLGRGELRLLAQRCAESLSDCGELVIFCDLSDGQRSQRLAAAEEIGNALGQLRQIQLTRHASAPGYLHQTILARHVAPSRRETFEAA
ncbi:hypothetical protein ACHFJ0_03650 [Paracoccus sp. NGMCC 1.201697]|uniref:Class I SAM-dependent methyltransferase n=1 Tax=Paracoccus broussonetiae subsp. drimophilus TaxID=3373869 RepID=A0ABW7LG63_9RHOB